MLTVAVAQTKPEFLDVEANFDGLIGLIGREEADIYLFPELCLGGYTFSTRDEVDQCALPVENDYFERLKTLTAERGIAVCAGYAEAAGDGSVYNSAFLIGDGELLANYRKTHLFYRETQFFTPGDSGFIVAGYRGVRIGMMICYDWIYPESARTLALEGAQVILHPSNLVLPYCQRAMFARAVENRVFIATANRVGRETNTLGDDLRFTGESQLVSPVGEYLLTFDASEVAMKTVTIDPSESDNKRLNEFNSLFADRKPEMYRTGAQS